MTARLNEADLPAIIAGDFEIGFDDDDPDKHQFAHICHKYPGKALCESDRLWFHGGSIRAEDLQRIDCQQCIERIRTRDVLELVEQALQLVGGAIELLNKREPEPRMPVPSVQLVARTSFSLLEVVQTLERERAAAWHK